MQNKRNYYRILHVQPDAPTEIIRMSYLTLMQRMKQHPDLGGDHTQAALINEAFATLVDPDRRALYDRALARDRAFPGYRSSHADRGRQSGRGTDAGAPDSDSCPFCAARCPKGDHRRPDAVCTHCDSPLTPPSRLDAASEARRAVERLPRHVPVTFHLSWPGPKLTGRSEDISINGMRFTTNVDLVQSERVRIDCEFGTAVGLVRHSRIAPGPPGLWDIGVEFLTLHIKPSRGVLVSTSA